MHKLEGAIFDLDGVVVTTDKFHFKAWKKLADELNIYFDEAINEKLRGVGRMECLEIILGENDLYDSKKEALATRKNEYYKEYLKELTDDNILPGAVDLIKALKENGILISIGSSSKNASNILKKLNLFDQFDAVVDGNHIRLSKPDPEVFLKAAKAMNIAPENCVVFEDAEAGVQAALSGNMKVVGVGSAKACKGIDLGIENLSEISIQILNNIY